MPIHYEKDGPVATFTIENGRVNVFTPAMHKELFRALNDFVADRALRVGIIAGSPGRSFCAGDDVVSPHPALSAEGALEAHLFPHAHEAKKGLTRPGWERDVLRLKRYKPIIGAVDQHCLGQGLIYLLHLTDLRIATPAARFGLPEVAYGMGGGAGLSRLGRQIPHALAMEMMLLGESIDADKALEFHLINRVVPKSRLMAEARAMASRIAAHPPIAVRIDMEAYQRSQEMPFDHLVDYVDTLFRFQRVAYQGPVPEVALRKSRRGD